MAVKTFELKSYLYLYVPSQTPVVLDFKMSSDPKYILLEEETKEITLDMSELAPKVIQGFNAAEQEARAKVEAQIAEWRTLLSQFLAIEN